MVHDLASEMELTDDLEAWGLWVGHELAGIVAWRLQADVGICRSILLAVDRRHRRRGYGRRLKEMELECARGAGARAVVSLVHFENVPVIQLNWSLGGTFSHPAGDPDHFHCIIAL